VLSARVPECQKLKMYVRPGPRCKSATGCQNQDRSRLSTNHRRSWRDRYRSWNATRPWMALNTSKCNHLMPVHFKGLIVIIFRFNSSMKFYYMKALSSRRTRGHSRIIQNLTLEVIHTSYLITRFTTIHENILSLSV